ncbi:MAG: polyribonucleotide nucleotidyltransferase, partial [Clostridia bacterium]|nr:polyribonucleotide nucleotidyltransferase [Clostridia bacterium]
GFIKREGRPTEKATLTCRLIDRPLRPLFPKGMRNDVQVVATILSVDKNIPPEIPAMIGSSIALAVSDIPWNGPTGSVVVGLIDGEFVCCPTDEQMQKSQMHLTVAGTRDAVLMVEAGAHEVSEEVMLEAIMFGHEWIKKLIAFQDTIIAEIGKEKAQVNLVTTGDDIKAAVRAFAYEKCQWVFDTTVREERQAREAQVKAETLEALGAQFEGRESEIADALYYLNKEIMRRKILDNGIRPDGRGVTDIRPIWCEVGVLPRTHGSAVFTRGQTQALTVTTLGSVSEGQILDGLSNEDFKRYIHHYNMPPYATGEAGRMKSPGRREIGHGALAERALLPVIPAESEFPYALRLVSEILSSNGSSSMASVCGSTLSLMDAGVPITAPVAGVAMGLIKDTESDKVVVLTDIQGLEDFLGDMDFKVAGSMNGITAIQMDIKIAGIDRDILRTALHQALQGRLFILGKMLECLEAPRAEVNQWAPKISQFTINPEKIREVIGPGGKMINKIIAETGVKIDIEDDGRVFISTPDADAAAKAKSIIMGIAKDIEVGEVYTGKVVRIMNFGAFVELLPGKDGMIHISKLANHRVEKVEDVVNIGDEIEVRVHEIDAQGRVNLIRNDIEYTARSEEPRRSEGFRGNRPPRRDGRN